MTQISGFEVTWADHVVTVRKAGVPPDRFDFELAEAHSILRSFRMSKPGSVWGCDGIGYSIQKRLGVVSVKKSGVGPLKFKQGVEMCKRLEKDHNQAEEAARLMPDLGS